MLDRYIIFISVHVFFSMISCCCCTPNVCVCVGFKFSSIRIHWLWNKLIWDIQQKKKVKKIVKENYSILIFGYKSL